MEDPAVVDTRAVGDLEELIRDRELHVAPGVGEQLRELRFLGGRLQDLHVEPFEHPPSALERHLRARSDYLRQVSNFVERVAFGDPLRAKGDIHLDAVRLESLLDEFGRTRVDRASQDDESSGLQVRHHLIDGALVHPHRRIHELIDRRADHHHDHRRATDRLWLAAEIEAAGGKQPGEQLVGAPFHERHLAGAHPLDLVGIGIVNADPVAGFRKAQRQRQSNVAAATDHDHVQVRGGGNHATISVQNRATG